MAFDCQQRNMFTLYINIESASLAEKDIPKTLQKSDSAKSAMHV